MNAYAVVVQGWMSTIASRLGLASESAAYANRSASIRSNAQATFAASGGECDVTSGPPPSPPPGPAPPPGPRPPVPAGAVTCVVEWEKDTKMHRHNSTGIAVLSCGSRASGDEATSNLVINNVTFANYGRAKGNCLTGFKKNASCTTSGGIRALTVVQNWCLGKPYCYVDASDRVFGDICPGSAKYLAVEVTCGPANHHRHRHRRRRAAAALSSAASESAFASAPHHRHRHRHRHRHLGGGGDGDGSEYQCYNDMPPPDNSSSSSQNSGGHPAEVRDGSVTSSPTSATAASLASLAKLPGTAQGVLSLVPFLTARQGRRGLVHGVETSGWMTGFMLEAGRKSPLATKNLLEDTDGLSKGGDAIHQCPLDAAALCFC